MTSAGTRTNGGMIGVTSPRQDSLVGTAGSRCGTAIE